MLRKESKLRIFDEFGEDISPKPLTDEEYESVKNERFNEMDKKNWLSKIKNQNDDVENEKVEEFPRKIKMEIITENYNKDFPAIKDGKLILRLKETNTIWLLSMDSVYSMDDDEDINRVKKDNEEYLKLTTGKALERKRSEDETQTPQWIEKSKGSMTTEIIKVDSFVNASAWDLYDTYAELAPGVSVTEKDFQKLIDTVLKAKDVAMRTLSGTSRMTYDEQIEQLFQQEDFKYALLISERLLASNLYFTKQSIFKKFLRSKYDDNEATSFTYEGCELWKYQIDFKNESFSVTTMDWNPSNPDLLAVGYGNLHWKSSNAGKVCIWSPKNPVHPERVFTLSNSVTSLSFSMVRPNILAIGCQNGDVYVADISTDEGSMRVLGRNKIHSLHGPVWKIQWFINKRLFKIAEELLAMGEGGILIRYSFPDDKETDSLLKINYVSAIKKSFLRPLNKTLPIGRREVSKVMKTFVKHSFSGLWFSTTSDEKLCYISTKEGVVIKAILINNCRVENIISSHVGPIYELELSPFTNLFYLTCGADWCLRIWMEGLSESLFTLKMNNPVMSAKWSPNISTLIGVISGSDFALWDIAKNVFLPANVIHFDGPNFTKLLFSPKGSNAVLGDESGAVRVLHLSQLPRQPFLQKETLVNAVDRGLFNKTELLKKFKRLVSLNKKALKTEIVV